MRVALAPFRALRELLRFLSFAFPPPVLAFVCDPDFIGAEDACSHGEAYAAQFGLEVVLVSDAAVVTDAVLDVAPELKEGPLAGLRIGIMHGRLVPDEKDRVMTAFAMGDLDVLVSTTVIEVGVDVPNATAMVIMDAERFGVSQLHQLRGRVGRGSNPGVCLLVTEAPPASPARERLDAVAGTRDGFQLSRLDLQQRREGDVLGAAQAGRRSSLKLLRLLADEDLIATAREEASPLVAADPKLEAHQSLKEAIDDFLGDRRAEFLDKTLFPGGRPSGASQAGGDAVLVAPAARGRRQKRAVPALWLG